MGVADISENGIALGWDEITLPHPVFAGDTNGWNALIASGGRNTKLRLDSQGLYATTLRVGLGTATWPLSRLKVWSLTRGDTRKQGFLQKGDCRP